MPLSIVVGGQFGGEGKGHISAYLARKDKVEVLVKSGGPNCGHHFCVDGKQYYVRMVPSGSNLGAKYIVFPPGSLINTTFLFDELKLLDFKGDILIDKNAGIIDQEYIDIEKNDSFYVSAGSTKKGVGPASAARCLRRLKIASQEPVLNKYIYDTQYFLKDALKSNVSILIEGSQSYGLSNYHGQYPYVTSRDTTVNAFMSHIGLGPKFIDNIIMVIKAFPTRNSDNIGVLPMEIENFDECLIEYSGPSKLQQRRVGLFSFRSVERAIVANTPTYIAITGLDKVIKLKGCPARFVEYIEERLRVPIALRSYGPNIEDIVDYREYYNV